MLHRKSRRLGALQRQVRLFLSFKPVFSSSLVPLPAQFSSKWWHHSCAHCNTELVLTHTGFFCLPSAGDIITPWNCSKACSSCTLPYSSLGHSPPLHSSETTWSLVYVDTIQWVAHTRFTGLLMNLHCNDCNQFGKTDLCCTVCSSIKEHLSKFKHGQFKSSKVPQVKTI